MKILVTEPKSFIGKNLIENLNNIKEGKNRTRPDLSISHICEYDSDLISADVIIILPGTRDVDKIIEKYKASSKIIYVTEVQGNSDPRYTYEMNNFSNILIYRFPTIIGKWQEPDKDKTIVAHLCDAVANDNSFVSESFLNRSIEMIFIDDFIDEILDALEGHPHRCNFPCAGEMSEDPTAPYDGKTPVPDANGQYCYSPKIFATTIDRIIGYLNEFNELNSTFIVPEIPAGSLKHRLYSMYLSYLPVRKMSYPLKMNVDNRGVFTELVKSVNNGQVSINIARPGVVRGQHWHNNKWEIFIVVSGHGLIQERKIGTDEVISFEVRGEDMRAVIMLPGYTHSIVNLENNRDLVTVMWANEQFDSNHPDTFFEVVGD